MIRCETTRFGLDPKPALQEPLPPELFAHLMRSNTYDPFHLITHRESVWIAEFVRHREDAISTVLEFDCYAQEPTKL